MDKESIIKKWKESGLLNDCSQDKIDKCYQLYMSQLSFSNNNSDVSEPFDISMFPIIGKMASKLFELDLTCEEE